MSGEIAAIPHAFVQNDDSHLLRDDLGKSPNVITDSTWAFGLEAQAIVDYPITPHIQIGGGVRHWGLNAQFGGVRFGPDFANSFSLNNFSLQRYGALLQLKGTF